MKELSELFHHNRTPVFVLIGAILMPLLYSERPPQAAPCIVGATLAVRPGCALSSLSGYMGILAWLTSAPLLATLGCRLAFTASLRTLIVCATTRLGQNTILLNFAVELLEG